MRLARGSTERWCLSGPNPSHFSPSLPLFSRKASLETHTTASVPSAAASSPAALSSPRPPGAGTVMSPPSPASAESRLWRYTFAGGKQEQASGRQEQEGEETGRSVKCFTQPQQGRHDPHTPRTHTDREQAREGSVSPFPPGTLSTVPGTPPAAAGARRGGTWTASGGGTGGPRSGTQPRSPSRSWPRSLWSCRKQGGGDARATRLRS